MNKNEQMITYKKSFWHKIKLKLLNVFSKNKKELIEFSEKTKIDTKSKTKEEIMDIYNGIKSNAVDLDNLDEDTLYKVMILLNKEIEISNQKLTDEVNLTKKYLVDLKMYNKEIELLKKNS